MISVETGLMAMGTPNRPATEIVFKVVSLMVAGDEGLTRRKKF
jgi:hypothetical protein